MTSEAGRIRDLLIQLIGLDKINKSKLCNVVSVDQSAFTCSAQYIDDSSITLYDVRLVTNSDSTCINIPKVGSLIIASPFEGGYYVSQFSEIDKYYVATSTESILTIMTDLIKAIQNIQVLTDQGPSLQNGVINTTDFDDITNRLKNFYLK